MNTRERGNKYEDLACQFLVGKGIKIIERNCYIHRFGELDIIASHGKDIIFFEIRSMRQAYIHPTQILSPTKKRRLKTLSRLWLFQNGYSEYSSRWRIDLIVYIGHNKPPEWFRQVL